MKIPCQGPRPARCRVENDDDKPASLTAGQSHTYGAYHKTGCNSADEIGEHHDHDTVLRSLSQGLSSTLSQRNGTIVKIFVSSCR